MSKSTALIFILAFAILFRLERPRLSQVGVVVLIVTGLFMFTFQSTTFDLEGFILVLLASVITGVRWTTAQLAIQKEELGLSNPVDTVFHLQPVMILTLLPLAILVDGVHIGTSEVVFRASSFQELLWTSVIILTASVVAFGLGTSDISWSTTPPDLPSPLPGY
ncbi:Solute carrier family 35 member C2 [Geodia barretti]|uniref:Solute carrier family 35 member C2 n=1 Tax=Geodia barretti TaxID=519541 RepID=A0AA35TQN8_GEOBA|nr:Solute carrier family 35 member C2 [Geodia barretti]